MMTMVPQLVYFGNLKTSKLHYSYYIEGSIIKEEPSSSYSSFGCTSSMLWSSLMNIMNQNNMYSCTATVTVFSNRNTAVSWFCVFNSIHTASVKEVFFLLDSGPQRVVKQVLLPTQQSVVATISLTLPSCSVPNHSSTMSSHSLKS